MAGSVQGTRRGRRADRVRPHGRHGTRGHEPATLGIASDFVRTGIEKAGIPLTQTLEAYLSITFARFIGAAHRRRPADRPHHPGDGRQRAARRDPRRSPTNA